MVNTPRIQDNTIYVGATPKNPLSSTRGPDEVMRALNEHTGQQWYAVKLSGYWLVYRESGNERAQCRGNFHKALATATGMTVVADVSS